MGVARSFILASQSSIDYESQLEGLEDFWSKKLPKDSVVAFMVKFKAGLGFSAA